MRSSVIFILLAATIFVSGCGKKPDVTPVLNQAAEQYVKLALALGVQDPDYVDAYYGPPQWKEEAAKQKLSYFQIRKSALDLQTELMNADVSEAPPEVRQRRQFLSKQVLAMIGRLDYHAGVKKTFDQSTQMIYDAVAPEVPDEHYAAILAEIDKLLPGSGTLTERVEAERKRFEIPKDKLAAVFQAAIDEARKRTLEHIPLPPNESFEVAYVTGKPWSAYNWYKGDAHSLIEVNTDLPIDIEFAIHLACHEGYPGHHVYNVLLETDLRNQRGWIEYSVYPLFSPESFLAEGTAEYGVDVVFPPVQRLKFLKEVLYPLAGLNPAGADRHFRLGELTARLRGAEIQVARRYLDGNVNREDAVQWLMKYALLSRERVEKRMSFINKYRGYIINYGYGRELVSEYMNSRGATPGNPAAQWKELRTLLSKPVAPSDLKAAPSRAADPPARISAPTEAVLSRVKL